MKYQCSICGETENLHYNLDYSKQHRPVIDVLCNVCGEVFDGNMRISDLPQQSDWDDVFNDVDFRNDIPVRIKNALKNNYHPPIKK
jgi:hypothetical protein